MLGLLDVQVAGADDHLDGVHAVGAVGERRDRLGAAHAVDAVDAAQAAGAEDDGVDLALGSRGCAHGHLDHPGRAGADDAHHDRARVGRAAGGNVDGRRGDRDLAEADLLALGKRDGAVGVDPGLGHDGHVCDRDLEARHELQRQPGDGDVELLLGDAQGSLGRVGGVEGARVAGHGRVPLALDVFDDRADVLGHRGGPGDHRTQARRHGVGAELGERRGVDALQAHLSPRQGDRMRQRRPEARAHASAARPRLPP